MEIDKTKLVDSQGRPITQSLFLEIGYTDSAVFTLKNQDYKYKGKTYPSLKRLYLKHEDPIEYDFAVTYLLGYDHWERICNNKGIAPHVEQWRKELELKIRSDMVGQMLELSSSDSFQAVKWLADKGWELKSAGRPKTKDKKIEDELNTKIQNEYGADIVRFKK